MPVSILRLADGVPAFSRLVMGPWRLAEVRGVRAGAASSGVKRTCQGAIPVA